MGERLGVGEKFASFALVLWRLALISFFFFFLTCQKVGLAKAVRIAAPPGVA